MEKEWEMERGRGLARLAVLAALASTCDTSARAEPSDQDVIDYRQQIMITNGEQAAAIGQILALMVPDENIAAHFKVLLEATRQAKIAFKPKVLGGKALPEVWENWDDFSARLDEAERNIEKAIKVAENPVLIGQIGEAAIGALSCKECHDDYRAAD